MAGGLEVFGVLEVVVASEEEEGVEGVEAALLGTVGSDGGAREGILGAEPELVVGLDHPVQLPSDRVLPKHREGVHLPVNWTPIEGHSRKGLCEGLPLSTDRRKKRKSGLWMSDLRILDPIRSCQLFGKAGGMLGCGCWMNP